MRGSDTTADGPVWRVVRLDALLGIVITGLVFAIVLAPELHLTGGALVATIGFHYVSPVMALLGWLLFGPAPDRVHGGGRVRPNSLRHGY